MLICHATLELTINIFGQVVIWQEVARADC